MHWAPGIPCALCLLGERFLQDSDASRREIAELYLKLERRHCEEHSDEANQPPSFRDGPKDQTRNLEIPGSMLCIAPE